jgi:hypothetical protein
MNNFTSTVLGLLMITMLCYHNTQGQCPALLPGSCDAPACKVASNGINVTVNAGEVLYVSSNYTSGTITLNGGTINVLEGINLTGGISNGSGGVINNCGTVNNGTNARSFNNTITLNNYAPGATIQLTQDNGFVFNNYADTASLIISGNPNSPVTITNASGAKLGASSVGDLHSGSSITNSGSITWTSSFEDFKKGAKITNNPGSTFNATNTANGGNSNLNIENYGKMTIAANGITLSGGNLNNYAYGNLNFLNGQVTINTGPVIHNWGTMSVYDFYNNSNVIRMHGNSLFNINHAIKTVNNSFSSDGCSVVNLSGPGTVEYDGPNNIVTSDPNINFCGKVPYNTAESGTITNISNTNPMTVTISSNQNGRISNGSNIYILDVNGNTSAIGYWTVSNLLCPSGNGSPCTFDLVGSSGLAAGVYSGGGTVYPFPRLGGANYLGYENCINPCPPLNVTFVSVKVVKDGDHAKVLWATSSEKNSAYFVIERSYEGADFEPIGVVNAAGNSSSMINYSFLDSDLFRDGIYYYRIKEVDLDNQFMYSHIASFKKTSTESVSIVQRGNTIYIDNSESPTMQVFLYSVDGKLLFEKNHQTQHLDIDISFLQSSAMYIVNVVTNVGMHYEKIVNH